MNRNSSAQVIPLSRTILVGLILVGFSMAAGAQMVYIVNSFDLAGTGGHSYSGGQIEKVWTNEFGGAFQSLVWDSASDSRNNTLPTFTANFSPHCDATLSCSK